MKYQIQDCRKQNKYNRISSALNNFVLDILLVSDGILYSIYFTYILFNDSNEIHAC